MVLKRGNRNRLTALTASGLLVLAGITIGVAGALLSWKYAAQYFFDNVPYPGLSLGLAIMQRDYDITDEQVSTIRNEAMSILEEIRIEAIAHDDKLDRRILDFVKEFKKQLTDEQGRKLDRDTLLYLRAKRSQVVRNFYIAIDVDSEQLYAIDTILARRYAEAADAAASYLEIPSILLRLSQEEIRAILRGNQVEKFDRFLAELLTKSQGAKP